MFSGSKVIAQYSVGQKPKNLNKAIFFSNLMHGIPEEILSLNVEEINFSDAELVKNLIIKLLNLIEQQAQNNHQLQEENQALKDEINRLKGEKQNIIEFTRSKQ